MGREQVGKRTSEEKGNILSNIIRITENIQSITVDCLDSYATVNQAEQEIKNCLSEIRAALRKLRELK